MGRVICRLRSKLHSLLVDEEGQDLVEYALVLSLVVTCVVASLHSVGVQLTAYYSFIVSQLP